MANPAPTPSSPSQELDNVAKSLKIYALTNLFADTSDPAIQHKIHQQIQLLQEELVRQPVNKIQEAFKEINKQLYHQPWKKLPNFHKLIKLAEYVKEKYNADTNLDQLNILLKAKLESKELPDKLVTYDIDLGKITDIKTIKYDEADKIYSLAPVPVVKKRMAKNT